MPSRITSFHISGSVGLISLNISQLKLSDISPFVEKWIHFEYSGVDVL